MTDRDAAALKRCSLLTSLHRHRADGGINPCYATDLVKSERKDAYEHIGTIFIEIHGEMGELYTISST